MYATQLGAVAMQSWMQKGAPSTYNLNVQGAPNDLRLAGQGYNIRAEGNTSGMQPGTCIRALAVPYMDTRTGGLWTLDVISWSPASGNDYLSNADGTPSGITRCASLMTVNTLSNQPTGPTPTDAAAAAEAERLRQEAIGQAARDAQAAADAAAAAAGEGVGPGGGAATAEWRAEYDAWIAEQEALQAQRLAEATAAYTGGGGVIPEMYAGDFGPVMQAGFGGGGGLDVSKLALYGAAALLGVMLLGGRRGRR